MKSKGTINAKTWQHDESTFEVGGGTFVVSIYNYENGNPDDLASSTGTTEKQALERAKLICDSVNQYKALLKVAEVAERWEHIVEQQQGLEDLNAMTDYARNLIGIVWGDLIEALKELKAVTP